MQTEYCGLADTKMIKSICYAILEIPCYENCFRPHCTPPSHPLQFLHSLRQAVGFMKVKVLKDNEATWGSDGCLQVTCDTSVDIQNISCVLLGGPSPFAETVKDGWLS